MTLAAVERIWSRLAKGAAPAADWRASFARIFASGLFDHDWYAAQNPDVWDSGLSPLEHFIKYGAELGRTPSANTSPSEAEAVRAMLRGGSAGNVEDVDPSVPLVSIICITYNQSRYIAQALDSILEQRADFAFEVLVGDDCSTDATPEIIAAYAAAHPNVVAVLRQANLGMNANFQDLTRRARGKFLAICEGDDYWTDCCKLQKQVDFFAEHPEYTVCFHPVRVSYESHPEIHEFFPETALPQTSLKQLAAANFIQTNSVMYRWRYGADYPFVLPSNLAPADWYIHLLQAQAGRIGYIDEVMAVYRKHSNGAWSSYASEAARSRKYGNEEIEFYRTLARRFGGNFRERFQDSQKSLFRRLATAFIDDRDIPSLFELIRNNQDICSPAMKELGFDDDTVDEPDASALERSILRQSRVSVIVTTYNHQDSLRRCLDSILAQEGLVDLQIIIGDDKSSDESPRILAEYAAEHSDKITFLRRDKNVGMLQNMKECLSLADGRYIAFCEGDDYWLSQKKLVKQISAVRPDPTVMMCFNWVLLELSATGSFIPHAEQSQLLQGEVPFFSLARRPLTANFSCCFYRAAAIHAVPESYYSSGSSADWLFNLYVANAGKVHFLKELLSVYTIQSRGQWSGLSDRDQRAKTIHFKREFARIFGVARGFEDIETRIGTWKEAKSLPSGVLGAVLDSPPKNDWLELADGSIRLQGWVLSPRQTTVIVSTETESRRVDLSLHRADVVASVLGAGRDHSDLITCGFSCPVSFAPGLKVRMEIEIDGERHDWLELSFEQR